MIPLGMGYAPGCSQCTRAALAAGRHGMSSRQHCYGRSRLQGFAAATGRDGTASMAQGRGPSASVGMRRCAVVVVASRILWRPYCSALTTGSSTVHWRQWFGRRETMACRGVGKADGQQSRSPRRSPRQKRTGVATVPRKKDGVVVGATSGRPG